MAELHAYKSARRQTSTAIRMRWGVAGPATGAYPFGVMVGTGSGSVVALQVSKFFGVTTKNNTLDDGNGNMLVSSTSSLSYTPSTPPLFVKTSGTGGGVIAQFQAASNLTSGAATSISLGVANTNGANAAWNYVPASTATSQTMGPTTATSPFQSLTFFGGGGGQLYLSGANQPGVFSKNNTLDDGTGASTFKTTATTNATAMSILTPNLVAGNAMGISLGVNSIADNTGFVGFTYGASGSSTLNFAYLQCGSANLNVYPTGAVTTPNNQLDSGPAGNATFLGSVTVTSNKLINSSGTVYTLPTGTSGALAPASQLTVNSYCIASWTVSASNVVSPSYYTSLGSDVGITSNIIQFATVGVYVMHCTCSVASVGTATGWTMTLSPQTASTVTCMPASTTEYNDSGLTSHAVYQSWQSVMNVTTASPAANSNVTFTSSITNQVVTITIYVRRIT